MKGAFLLLPEYLLTALGLLILVADWFVPRDRKRYLAWLGCAGLLAALVATVHVTVGSADQKLPAWASVQLEVDIFSGFFKVIVIVGTLLVMMASPGYLEKRVRHSQGEFYALLIFAALGMSLMAASKDLISLFLSMEFTSITSYILAGYQKTEAKSAEAGIKYFLIGVVSSGVMLYGMSLIYGATGETGLYEIAERVRQTPTNPLLIPALIMVLAGFAFKMALVPFHMWCPDTYEGAPTPFAAILSVGPKAAGFAMMMRVFLRGFEGLQDQWSPVVAIVAALTMTVGNLAALSQTNLKRMLAYSSIAQAGYILIGMAAVAGFKATDSNELVAGWKYSGILLYLFSYAFMNIGAFVCAMVLLEGNESEEISDCRLMVRRSPLTAISFLIFAGSLAGIPATAGFIAKMLVFGAAIRADLVWLAVVGWINTVISVYYYFNVVKHMFGFAVAPADVDSDPKPIASPRLLQLSIAACAILTVVIGVFPQPFVNLTKAAAYSFWTN